jgi:hypothetical protein
MTSPNNPPDAKLSIILLMLRRWDPSASIKLIGMKNRIIFGITLIKNVLPNASTHPGSADIIITVTKRAKCRIPNINCYNLIIVQ